MSENGNRMWKSIKLWGNNWRLFEQADTGQRFLPGWCCARSLCCPLTHDHQYDCSLQLAPNHDALSFFQGSEIGYDYSLFLERICENSECSPSCLVVSLIYLERLQQRFSSPILSSKSVKRLLLVSIMIAAKCLEDRYFKNSSWYRLVIVDFTTTGVWH